MVINMSSVYKVIKGSSVVIRQFFMPNPFEIFENGIVYNWVASGILVPITFFMVGFLYENGTAPFIGSLLFLILYLINTFVLMLCSVFSFNFISCLIIGLIYLTIFILVVKVRNFVFGGY